MSGWDALRFKGNTWAESEGIEKDTPHKCNKKKSRVVVLKSDKIDYISKFVTREELGNYIIIKEEIQK